MKRWRKETEASRRKVKLKGLSSAGREMERREVFKLIRSGGSNVAGSSISEVVGVCDI